ncbi:MAG: hypothetical protein JWM98_2721 [Thermoleophilia bacterium]|nr:hypothetical protein [Thermoleophilia bacterium]
MTYTDDALDTLVRDATIAEWMPEDDRARMLLPRLHAAQNARSGAPSVSTSRRRPRRRWSFVASPLVAAAMLAAIALAPWEDGGRGGPSRRQAPEIGAPGATDRPAAPSRRSVVLRAIPGIETASAQEVLTHVADTMRDTGTGPWLYLRRSYWNAAWGNYSLTCGGSVTLRTCTWKDEKTGAKTTTRPDFPVVRNTIWERWSDGAHELGRSQYSGPVMRPCDAKPSPADQCLGNTGIWLRGRTRSSFPSDPALGAAELNRLVGIRNRMVAGAAARTGRYAPNSISATEIGFWLLTEPVYDAQGRAGIIRVLANWPGARNLGPKLDHLGRRGVEIEVPTYHRYGGNQAKAGFTGTFHAIFDVRHGQLLEYTQTNSREADLGPDEGWISIDEQTRQQAPTATDETVQQVKR